MERASSMVSSDITHAVSRAGNVTGADFMIDSGLIQML
jgi:hypothetical protein